MGKKNVQFIPKAQTSEKKGSFNNIPINCRLFFVKFISFKDKNYPYIGL